MQSWWGPNQHQGRNSERKAKPWRIKESVGSIIVPNGMWYPDKRGRVWVLANDLHCFFFKKEGCYVLKAGKPQMLASVFLAANIPCFPWWMRSPKIHKYFTYFHGRQKDQWLKIMTSLNKVPLSQTREDLVEPFHYAENILHKPGGSGPSPTLGSGCVPCCHAPLATEPLVCSSSLQDTVVFWAAISPSLQHVDPPKSKACLPKAVLQQIPPDEFIPGLLDGGVTHRLELIPLGLSLLFPRGPVCGGIGAGGSSESQLCCSLTKLPEA